MQHTTGRKRPVDSSRFPTKVPPKALANIKEFTKDWRWPLKKVYVTSKFGRRGKRMHEGLDLDARTGTKVYSVDGGKVLYATNKISGYGNMVVVEHLSGLFSVYAHLSKFKVKKGDSIQKGKLLGLSGATGRVTGPHLHFEVRRGTVALNPREVMPSGRKVAGK